MKKLILTSLLCVSPFVHAQDQSPTSATMQFTKEAAEVPPKGWLPFIAAGVGYTGYGGGENGSAEGTPGTLKILGSFYYEKPWVADIGYGFNSQYFNQSSAKDTSISNSAFELAARYKWDNRWQAGVVADHLSNQGMNYNSNQADAQFVGLQVMKEFNTSPEWLARIGARAMGLTNNTGNQVYMYLVDLQIGWNPSAYKTSVKSTAQAPAVQAPVIATQPPPHAMPEAEPALLRDISYSSIATPGTIQFSSAKFMVNKKDRTHLAKVAVALNGHKDLLERVEVVGYADSSGNAEANEKLSLARANQVKRILERSGLKEIPVTAIAKGSSEASKITLKTERRAELVFIGVKDETALKNVLASIE
jgi:OOP family OmpA-OmpF porin